MPKPPAAFTSPPVAPIQANSPWPIPIMSHAKRKPKALIKIGTNRVPPKNCSDSGSWNDLKRSLAQPDSIPMTTPANMEG